MMVCIMRLNFLLKYERHLLLNNKTSEVRHYELPLTTAHKNQTETTALPIQQSRIFTQTANNIFSPVRLRRTTLITGSPSFTGELPLRL